MSNIARNSIGSQRQRQFAGPIDADVVFETLNDMNNYLSRAIRYAGMMATCLEEEGKLFILNNAKDEWLEASNGDGETSEVNAFTSSDITVPVAVGEIKRGDVIPAGTNLQTFLRNYLFKQPVFESKVTTPTFLFRMINKTPVDSNFYVGDKVGFDLEVHSINRGKITGDIVETVWDETAIRAENYAGEVLEVKIDNVVVEADIDGKYIKSYTNVTIPTYLLVYQASVKFDDGVSTRITSVGDEIADSEYESKTILRGVSLKGVLQPAPEPEPVPPPVIIQNPTFVAPIIRLGITRTLRSDGDLNVTITVLNIETHARGSIKGAIVSDNWSSTAFQDYRTGSVIGYRHADTIIDAGTGETWGNNTVRSITFVAPNANKVYAVAMQYQEGPQPTNSAGGNFDSPLPAGYIVSSVFLTRIIPTERYFTGTRTSSQLTSIVGMVAKNISGTSFSFTVVAGTPKAQMPAFAMQTTRTIKSVKEPSGMILTFTKSSVFNVSGINYFMYYLETLAFDTLPINFTFEVNF